MCMEVKICRAVLARPHAALITTHVSNFGTEGFLIHHIQAIDHHLLRDL